jgi:hypothetical protein
MTTSDTATNSKHKSMCEGLKNILASDGFVHNLAVMLDALEAISDLSKSLQRENCSLGEAYGMVTRTIRDLRLQKSDAKGHYCFLYEEASAGGEFRGVTLDGNRHSMLNKSAFLQALIDNLNSRLYTQAGFSNHQEEIDVLNPQKVANGCFEPMGKR